MGTIYTISRNPYKRKMNESKTIENKETFSGDLSLEDKAGREKNSHKTDENKSDLKRENCNKESDETIKKDEKNNLSLIKVKRKKRRRRRRMSYYDRNDENGLFIMLPEDYGGIEKYGAMN